MSTSIRVHAETPTIGFRAQTLRVALAGNPNSGKTTIFNALTGSRQRVGNYPGVTVEIKGGTCRYGDAELAIVDLPGTYSLTAHSPEELVARRFLLEDSPDVVVVIVDASNLERNLYLAVQILELQVPVVLAFNMWDLATAHGAAFDLPHLERLLGTRIVPTVGHRAHGLSALPDTVLEVARAPRTAHGLCVSYEPEIDGALSRLAEEVAQAPKTVDGVPNRWLALKLLEEDPEVARVFADPALLAAAQASAAQLHSALGDSPAVAIAGGRYDFIRDACARAIRPAVWPRRSFSDRVDAILTHRLLGLPILLGLMYLVFHLTFTLGEPPMGWIEGGFEALKGAIGGLLPGDGLLRSLLVDGIIGGVGSVLVFLPNIVLLFLAIALLEDSGYMARAAFLMDRLMHSIGLHGKSFIPMLLGFGCSVPAIMATRTLENRRDRLATMLVLPLMSCGARLPIYTLLIPAFFPEAWRAPMLWLMYLIGIALAIAAAKLLRSTLLRGEAPLFVMELPPYRIPTLRGLLLHLQNQAGGYLRKAGTIILGLSVLLWAMAQWPALSEERAAGFEAEKAAVGAQADLGDSAWKERLAEIENAQAEAGLQVSLIGRIGQGMEPLFRPLGFDWRISTALLGALAAKEVFVAQLGIVYSLGEADPDDPSAELQNRLQADYSPLQAFCMMLFCLISAPCVATLAMTRRESGSWAWALFQFGGLTAMAWVLTAIVYQAGRLLG
jgi:ferrous iron transport protein B